MKKDYETPSMEDLGSLDDLTQGLVILGINLDGDGGGGGGGGNTFS